MRRPRAAAVCTRSSVSGPGREPSGTCMAANDLAAEDDDGAGRMSGRRICWQVFFQRQQHRTATQSGVASK